MAMLAEVERAIAARGARVIRQPRTWQQNVPEVCDIACCLRHDEIVGRVNIDDVTAADLVDLTTGVRRQAA